MTTRGQVMQPASPLHSAPPQRVRGRGLVVVGASGGVGTSTVAAILGAADGGAWRIEALAAWLVQRGPLPRPDVVVTGVSVHAAEQARRLLGEGLARMGARPLLVVVSDGRGRPPVDARAQLTMLRPLVRGRVDIPYVSAWRSCTTPAGLSAPPRDAVAAFNRLRAEFDIPPVAAGKKPRGSR